MIQEKLASEARRLCFTVLNAIKASSDGESAYVRQRHLAARSRLQPKELPAVLDEVIAADLFTITPGKNGVLFRLKPFEL